MPQKTDPLYQNVFNYAFDGILIIDLDTGSVLAANPAAAQMHATTINAFTGSRLEDFIHATSLHLFKDFLMAIQQGKTFEIQAEHKKLDGTLFSMEWHALAFPYKNRTCALAFLRDLRHAPGPSGAFPPARRLRFFPRRVSRPQPARAPRGSCYRALLSPLKPDA